MYNKKKIIGAFYEELKPTKVLLKVGWHVGAIDCSMTSTEICRRIKSYILAKFVSIIDSTCKTKNALQLDDSKAFLVKYSRAYGNRTRHSSVKGRCINRFTNAPSLFFGLQIYWLISNEPNFISTNF